MSFAPACVLVMRHAEKPDDARDPNLSAAGLARAQALADYLPATFFVPDHLFASSISKHSARPYETVEPLARKTGVPIDTTFADEDYGALAEALLASPAYAGKRIVVCWHHGHIPALLQALGCAAGGYPDPWPGDVFNRIVKLDAANGAVAASTIAEPF
jgi:phosphohistidine phosphatase SixA